MPKSLLQKTLSFPVNPFTCTAGNQENHPLNTNDRNMAGYLLAKLGSALCLAFANNEFSADSADSDSAESASKSTAPAFQKASERRKEIVQKLGKTKALGNAALQISMEPPTNHFFFAENKPIIAKWLDSPSQLVSHMPSSPGQNENPGPLVVGNPSNKQVEQTVLERFHLVKALGRVSPVGP